MNYRTGKILLITSLLLLPAAWSPAWGEEPAFLYTHIHREGSSVTREESRVEEKTSSKTTTHSDVSVNLPSAPAAGGIVYPYLAKNKLPGGFRPEGGRRCLGLRRIGSLQGGEGLGPPGQTGGGTGAAGVQFHPL